MSMLRLLLVALLAGASLTLTSSTALASSLSLPGSRQQHALALRHEPQAAGGPAVLARACRPGGACTPSGGDSFPIPATADAKAVKVEQIMLEGGKLVALVSAPLRPGPGRWVLMVSASSPPDAPAVLKNLTGSLDKPIGKLEGERRKRVLVRDKGPSGEQILIGKQYEGASVCGRAATFSVKALDPADLTWRATSARSLSRAERDAAGRVTAVPSASKFGWGEPKLLHGTVASSAIGKNRAGLTDRDFVTRWAENRAGAGSGEFIVMSSAPEVAITGFELVVRPATEQPAGAAPRTFYIATSKQLLRVTMPDDAWLQPPGVSYSVTLPQPIRTDCVALVLEDAYLRDGADQVTLAELRARTEFEGSDFAKLLAALGEDAARAEAAKALLMRSGDDAVKAAIGAYDELTSAARGRALEVIDSGNCQRTAPFFVARLVGDRQNLKTFEPELDTLAKHARDRLRMCRSAGRDALADAIRKRKPGKRRVWAARELADVAPAAAIAVILEVLEDGSKAPAAPGGADAVRRGLRRALGAAIGHRRAQPALEQQLQGANFSKLSLVKRIDLLRAIGPRLSTLPSAAPALLQVVATDSSMRTRYLLQEPAAHLARGGDASALRFLRDSLRRDDNRHVRARAAAMAGGIAALVGDLDGALSDKAPRVREAALTGLVGSAAHASPAMERTVLQLLGNDPWTFVRVGAARALAKRPRAARSDTALIAALDDETSVVRKAVLRALGERKSLSAAEAVHDIADNPSEAMHIRVAAIAALGDMCHLGSAELLFKLALRAGTQQLPYDQPLGLAALAALGNIKPPDLAKHLTPLVRDKRAPRTIRAIARDAIMREGGCGKN